MENDIRHVTVFLSLAITIRLGPTDIILDNNRRKNLVNHSSRSFLPRFSSPKHREKSIRSNNASIIERRIDPPPILTRLDSPTHLCNADVYVFSSPPFFVLSILLRAIVTVHEALDLLENLSNPNVFERMDGNVARLWKESFEEIDLAVGKYRGYFDDELFVSGIDDADLDLFVPRYLPRRKRTFYKLIFYFS